MQYNKTVSIPRDLVDKWLEYERKNPHIKFSDVVRRGIRWTLLSADIANIPDGIEGLRLENCRLHDRCEAWAEKCAELVKENEAIRIRHTKKAAPKTIKEFVAEQENIVDPVDAGVR